MYRYSLCLQFDIAKSNLLSGTDEDFAFEDEEMNPNEREDPNRYFTKLRTKHQDLLHDFGATEVFLIEGTTNRIFSLYIIVLKLEQEIHLFSSY